MAPSPIAHALAVRCWPAAWSGPNYVRPPVEQPAGFKSQAANGDGCRAIPPEWWRLYVSRSSIG